MSGSAGLETKKTENERTFTALGVTQTVSVLPPALYVVATPIGNLDDISLRALKTLAAADLILCEDTRHSARLLDHYGIKRPRTALHEHNETARIAGLVDRLAQGEALALISDAGTPLLSDPGFPLVRAVRAAGHKIVPVPGASALLAGLVTAGLPTDRFSFFGFLPAKAGQRQTIVQELAERTETLVFYESPRRLAEALAAMAKSFGADRQALVALELTKAHEREAHGTLHELAARFAAETPKGEAVILVAGAPPAETVDDETWRAALAEALAEDPLRTAVDRISADFKIRRKTVYAAALTLKQDAR